MLQHLRHVVANRTRHNLNTLGRSPAAEISGALGDLGTLLPLMIALAMQGSINLPATLVFSGLFNITTGALFGIPLPVQPMKAIAASALAQRASLPTTTAAGALVSLAILFLSSTGLIHLLTKHTPVPIIKGIQLGAALRLVTAASSSLLLPLSWAAPFLDNRLLAIFSFVILLISPPRVPFALVATCLAVFAATLATPSASMPHFDPWRPTLMWPDWGSSTAWGMALSQLPLTTLNSVVAVAALAGDLMLPTTPSTTALGISVGLMNLVSCWTGAMPVCHGSGGLAAQYRFGARSGASVVMLGLVKVGLGLAAGESLAGVLGRFPRALLGVMVVGAGLELAKVGASLNRGAPDLWEESVTGSEGELVRKVKVLSVAEEQERWNVMVMTAVGMLAFKNDAIGFAVGLVAHAAYRTTGWASGRWRLAVGERMPLLR